MGLHTTEEEQNSVKLGSNLMLSSRQKCSLNVGSTPHDVTDNKIKLTWLFLY